MSEYTIVEKYQQTKKQSVAVRPYFNPNKENMGLESYGLALHDGVYHEESLACLEMNGVKRYVTGLNEFAPEVKMLPPKERKAKIKEIREVVAELEASLAANVVDPEDKDFWNNLSIMSPNNDKFWDKISELPDLQCAWLLLLYCASPRFNYTVRTLPPSSADWRAEEHDKGV